MLSQNVELQSVKRAVNIADDLNKKIQDGIKGVTWGYPNMRSPLQSDLSPLGKSTRFGRKTYHVLGAEGGAGKSAFMLQEYVIKPYLYWRKTQKSKPLFLWWHTERGADILAAKIKLWFMYVYHDVLMDVPTLMGFENKMRDLHQDDLDLLTKYDSVIKEIESMSEIYTGTPDVMEMELVRKDIVKKAGPDVQVIQLTDHLSNLIMGGASEKQTIDQHSDFAKQYRDDHGWAIVDVMQFNRGVDDTYRQKNSGELKVKKSDFYGSHKPQMNADVMIGMLNPRKYQEVKHYGYEMDDFFEDTLQKFRFRSIFVVKNSYGPEDFFLPYAFIGECGYFQGIHLPPEILPAYSANGIKFTDAIKEARHICKY